MKKNIVQDVIPPRRTIRNIDLPSRSRKSAEKIVKPEAEESEGVDEVLTKSRVSAKKETKKIPRKDEESSEYKYEYDEMEKPPKHSKKILYAALGLFIVAVLFGISALFKSAEIKITPKQEIKALNEIFTAKKDATNSLGFQLVSISKDVEKTAEATSEQFVEKKAQGRIIIYNNAGTQTQKLVATTRFQTPEGLIFRLINNVIVPGRKVVEGKTVAGSIEVTVEADKAGTDYNIGLKDFTIPGFKGDSKYTQVYARSKTAMTGGFSGMQKIVSSEIVDKISAELDVELKKSLIKDITSQIPSNFVLYENTISYKFDPVNQVNSTNGGAVLKKKGYANAIIFDKGVLSRAIMSKVLPNESGDVIKIINLEKLTFSYSNPDTFNPSTDTSVSFGLKGEPNFVWVFDENKLKSDLLGLSKNNAKTVISTYPNIKEAWVETHPFWNNTIPKDTKKVDLINTLTK